MDWSVLHASIDTCCLINLLADEFVLSSLGSRSGKKEPVKFFTPMQVSKEVVFLLRPQKNDPSKLERVEVDLAPHHKSGLIEECDFTSPEELDLFVKLAADLDDGEAACLAIAANRKWLLATDDRVARRLADNEGVQVITTPMIIRRWADDFGISKTDLARVINSIGRFAKFVPHHSSADYGWWASAASP